MRGLHMAAERKERRGECRSLGQVRVAVSQDGGWLLRQMSRSHHAVTSLIDKAARIG